MRTRAHNAALKGLRIMNERKAAKREEARLASLPSDPERIAPGVIFDHLTALEEVGRDEGGRLRWLFECSCGARVTWNVATVTHNLRKLGWCSCPSCYQAAGGWKAIVARRAADSTSSAHVENHSENTAKHPANVGRRVGARS